MSTAYYLAKVHGVRNIAVLEKGWIGGGNVGRNTAIIRSNYLNVSNALFYEFSIKLWRSLSSELNFNVMYSPRGALFLAHSDAQMDSHARLGNSMRLNGIDVELLDRDRVRNLAPYLNFSDTARFPISGALLQPRAGNARHDAIVWGYARGADRYGVDIIQNCAVEGIKIESGRVVGLNTTKGFIATRKIGLAVAGHTSRLAEMAGLRLPVETHLLQAMVTEPLKPFMNHIISFGAGHFHVNQTDKGGLVMGGDLDGYNSYSQRQDDIATVGTTHFRPPFTPVSVSALAGPFTGLEAHPTLMTPLHAWHVSNGAVMTNTGQWVRASHYPRYGESYEDTLAREASAVRRSVGICDTSTLGKFSITGPDATEFLNRIYCNGWNTLTPGKARFGIMLREDGIVLDDGTTSCHFNE